MVRNFREKNMVEEQISDWKGDGCGDDDLKKRKPLLRINNRLAYIEGAIRDAGLPKRTRLNLANLLLMMIKFRAT